jgi:hypothetical protein
MPGPRRRARIPQLGMVAPVRADLTDVDITVVLRELCDDIGQTAPSDTIDPVVARMPSGHPEFADAQKILLGVREPVGKIWRVYAAGDPLAELDGDGVPRQTILYLRFRDRDDAIGEPWTAFIDGDGVVQRRAGWGVAPVA